MAQDAASGNRNLHLFDDLDAEALQRWNVGRRIGQQTDAANPQVRENLASQPDLAQRSPGSLAILLV